MNLFGEGKFVISYIFANIILKSLIKKEKRKKINYSIVLLVEQCPTLFFSSPPLLVSFGPCNPVLVVVLVPLDSNWVEIRVLIDFFFGWVSFSRQMK